MEENEGQNQPNDEWNAGSPHEPKTEVAMEVEAGGNEPPAPKNPDDTPTGELVADYEALLAEIKVRKTNHEDQLRAIDAMRNEEVAGYENAVKGASVEAAKLLVLISKRLGMPLNEPTQSVSQNRRLATQDAPQVPFGQPSPQICPVKGCGKELRNGAGMHLAMHRRNGELVPEQQKPFAVATTGSARVQRTKWCEPCGLAINIKGWTQHQAAHQRHGRVLPRKVQFVNNSSARKQGFTQSMSDEKCRELCRQLAAMQPITMAEFSRRIGKPNQSAFFTGLKERGLVINHNTKWTLTPKGAALI